MHACISPPSCPSRARRLARALSLALYVHSELYLWNFAHFGIGDKVLNHLDEGGTIVAMNRDKTFAIKYDSGIFEPSVLADEIVCDQIVCEETECEAKCGVADLPCVPMNPSRLEALEVYKGPEAVCACDDGFAGPSCSAGVCIVLSALSTIRIYLKYHKLYRSSRLLDDVLYSSMQEVTAGLVSLAPRIRNGCTWRTTEHNACVKRANCSQVALQKATALLPLCTLLTAVCP
jgi:hypothetical protein